MTDPRLWISFGLAVFLVSAVPAGILVWRLGFEGDSTQISGTQRLAGVIPLAVAMVSGSITFIGGILRLASERENQARSEAAVKEAEKRLRLDTVVGAVGLMTKDKESPQNAAALMALVQLDNLDLAIAMLFGLWSRDGIGASEACWIIDQAANSGDDKIQLDAMIALEENAHKLDRGGQSYDFPTSLLDTWRTDLPIMARVMILRSLVTALCSAESEISARHLLSLYGTTA